MDYAKYREDVTGRVGTPVHVGIGVRITAKITTKKANIGPREPFRHRLCCTIRPPASGHLHGRIGILKIGIESPELNAVTQSSSEINDTSLENACRSMAWIRAKLYDKETIVRPHVLARQAHSTPVRQGRSPSPPAARGTQ